MYVLKQERSKMDDFERKEKFVCPTNKLFFNLPTDKSKKKHKLNSMQN